MIQILFSIFIRIYFENSSPKASRALSWYPSNPNSSFNEIFSKLQAKIRTRNENFIITEIINFLLSIKNVAKVMRHTTGETLIFFLYLENLIFLKLFMKLKNYLVKKMYELQPEKNLGSSTVYTVNSLWFYTC